MINLKKFKTNPVINNHFRNFKGFITGGVLAIVLGYVGNYLINKNLSKEDLGLFSYYYNLLTLLTTIFSLNIYTSYLRFNNDIYDTSALKRIIKRTSVISTIALSLVTYLISKNFFLVLFSLLILFNERIYFFRSEKKISKMNWTKYISSIFLIIFLLINIKTHNLTFDKALFSYGVSYFICIIFAFVFFDKKINNTINNHGETLNIKIILKYSIPASLTGVVLWISHVSDQIIMKEFLSLTELGTYAISYRIIVVIQIFTSLFLLYYPMLYFEEAVNKNYKVIKKIRFGFILILFFFTLSLILFRKNVYIVLGATKYLEFTNIFIFLVIAEFIRIVSGLFLTYRSFTLQTWYSFFSIGIPSIIQFVLNFIFIPKYGLYFAAITQIMSSILYFSITYFFAIIPEKQYFSHD